MTSQAIDLPGNALVALTRDSLLALRDAMFRDIGPNAAALLQEAGYAGGPALFDAFSQWLASRGAAGARVTRRRGIRDRGPRSSFARPAGDRSSSARSSRSRRSTPRIGPRAIPRIRSSFPAATTRPA